LPKDLFLVGGCAGSHAFERSHLTIRTQHGAKLEHRWARPFNNLFIAPQLCLNNFYDACFLRIDGLCAVRDGDDECMTTTRCVLDLGSIICTAPCIFVSCTGMWCGCCAGAMADLCVHYYP